MLVIYLIYVVTIKQNIIDEYLDNKSPDFTADFKFLLLTNAPELKDISKVIDKSMNSSEHTNFLN